MDRARAKELAPVIKIASGEMTNLDLIGYAASKDLPLIISTGMAIDSELVEALDAGYPADKHPVDHLALLHCTSIYPTALDAVNLLHLQALNQLF